jgi:uncharacterized OsmC-like protein
MQPLPSPPAPGVIRRFPPVDLLRRGPMTVTIPRPATTSESSLPAAPATLRRQMPKGERMNLRELQQPIKERYVADPTAARITLRATGTGGDGAMSCSVDIGRALYAAGAHPGVGGAGTSACSGDLLLGALAACAQLTCQMVATNMGLDGVSVGVTVEGDLDLRGTLGTPDVPVGFEAIRLRFDLAGDGIPAERMAKLIERTERYCVVLQTLLTAPAIETRWEGGATAAS